MVFRYVEKCWVAHLPVPCVTKSLKLQKVWSIVWKMSLSRCPPKHSRKIEITSTNFHARSCIPTHDPTLIRAEGLTRLRHCSATRRNESDAMLAQHSNYNGHCRLPEHFWIKSTARSRTIQFAEKITFLSLLQRGKSCTMVCCILKFRMEKTCSVHEVQLRKCSGKAAKDRGKLVKILAWKLGEAIANLL